MWLNVHQQSQSTASEEVSVLKDLLQGVVVNNVFPLEDQLANLSQSYHVLSEESQEVKEVWSVNTSMQLLSCGQYVHIEGNHHCMSCITRMCNLVVMFAAEVLFVTYVLRISMLLLLLLFLTLMIMLLLLMMIMLLLLLLLLLLSLT